MNKSNSNMAKQAQDRLSDDGNPLEKSKLTMAQQIAEAASGFQKQRTGHAPQAVSVVQSDGTLVITMHGALSPAEQAMARSQDGAAKVQEFHRQLFKNSSESLRAEIKRITGVEVREAIAEIEPAAGIVVHAFTTGTMVHVFLLAQKISADIWNGNGSGDRSMKTEVQPC